MNEVDCVTMALTKLLIVDDDREMREMMAEYLRRSGFIAYIAATGEDIQKHLAENHIDLILLDVMLEYESGIEICKTIRQEQDVPIILVSALAADHQRMSGYMVGADDYIAKPFNPELLLARVHAVLRRVQRTPSLTYRRNISSYDFNSWRYDGTTDEVYNPKGVQVSLSQRETKLLKVLLANPHIALSRDEIITSMDKQTSRDGADTPIGKALDVLVGRLRGKIEADPKHPQMLKTERNVGYVFAVTVTKLDE